MKYLESLNLYACRSIHAARHVLLLLNTIFNTCCRKVLLILAIFSSVWVNEFLIFSTCAPFRALVDWHETQSTAHCHIFSRQAILLSIFICYTFIFMLPLFFIIRSSSPQTPADCFSDLKKCYWERYPCSIELVHSSDQCFSANKNIGLVNNTDNKYSFHVYFLLLCLKASPELILFITMNYYYNALYQFVAVWSKTPCIIHRFAI